jgi:hypothetical protein
MGGNKDGHARRGNIPGEAIKICVVDQVVVADREAGEEVVVEARIRMTTASRRLFGKSMSLIE